MTSHRPHPISGPYPYGVADSTGEVQPRHPWANATAVPLAERIPIEGSLIYDDPEDAILHDGCDRCAEHARGVLNGSLDANNIARLWRRMVEVERDPECRAGYRTAIEGEACRTLYVLACFIEHTHPQINPWAWPWHLRAGGVSFAVDGTIGVSATSMSLGGIEIPMPGDS